jgi:hypothetical protein
LTVDAYPAGEAAKIPGPIVARLACTSLSDGWIWLPGPRVRQSHNHGLGDLANVVLVDPYPGDGAIITWNAAAEVWKSVNGLPTSSLGDISGLSVLGNGTNSTGPVLELTAGTDGFVLRRSGTTLAFGQVATGGITNLAVTTAKIDDLGVTTGKIDNLAVTTGKLAANAVTTAKMDSPIAAAGPIGGTTTIPVITYDASGRLTTVTTATVTLAALGASAAATMSLPVSVANGGLGKTSIAADRMLYSSSANTYAESAITAQGRGLLDDADAAANRVTIGINFSAADKYHYSTGVNTIAEGSISSFARGLLDDADAATMRTTLGVASGTVVAFTAGTTNTAIGTSMTTHVFDTEEIDTDTAFDTSTGIFTCPEDGTYAVGYSMWFDLTLAGGAGSFTVISRLLASAAVFPGGVANLDLQSVENLLVNESSYVPHARSVLVELTAGDTLKVQLQRGGSLTPSLNAASAHFHAHRIGD